MVKIKIDRDELTPASSDLCCKINHDYMCAFCKHIMCETCAKTWSYRKHFIVDMCRKRYTYAQIKKANDCFKKRIVNGVIPKTLGDCYVCKDRRKHLFDTDRERVLTKRR